MYYILPPYQGLGSLWNRGGMMLTTRGSRNLSLHMYSLGITGLLHRYSSYMLNTYANYSESQYGRRDYEVTS